MQYCRTIVQHMTANASNKLSSDQWWVIAPAIEEINKTFVMSQSRSLLITQQESLIQTLIGTLVAMFDIVHADDADEFETFEEWCIERAELVLYVKDQGSFPKLCYERLDGPAQKEVMSQLAQYAMFIVTGFGNIRAERDENNEPLKQDAPLVMPNPIVKLHHGDFIEQVFDLYRDHVSKFWSEESIDQVEEGHRYLLKMYNEDTVQHAALDKHDVQTTFNDAWDAMPQQARDERLCAFLGGLATAFTNMTVVESNFSILKWEMDEFRTCLMHLSLEGIF
ncbi:unnamed protein product [Sphagnum troendelagicum]